MFTEYAKNEYKKFLKKFPTEVINEIKAKYMEERTPFYDDEILFHIDNMFMKFPTKQEYSDELVDTFCSELKTHINNEKEKYLKKYSKKFEIVSFEINKIDDHDYDYYYILKLDVYRYPTIDEFLHEKLIDLEKNRKTEEAKQQKKKNKLEQLNYLTEELKKLNKSELSIVMKSLKD